MRVREREPEVRTGSVKEKHVAATKVIHCELWAVSVPENALNPKP